MILATEAHRRKARPDVDVRHHQVSLRWIRSLRDEWAACARSIAVRRKSLSIFFAILAWAEKSSSFFSVPPARGLRFFGGVGHGGLPIQILRSHTQRRARLTAIYFSSSRRNVPRSRTLLRGARTTFTTKSTKLLRFVEMRRIKFIKSSANSLRCAQLLCSNEQQTLNPSTAENSYYHPFPKSHSITWLYRGLNPSSI
jgi:hypothetical protein